MDESTIGRGRLAGKVAMVTGAGSGPDAVGIGIGEAIARLFAREGARVLAVDNDEARAARTVTAITAEGSEATVYIADVSVSGQCRTAVEAAVDRYGGLDVLVNNVGISVLGSVVDLDLDGYQRAMDVNLKSMVLTSRYAVPVMIEGGGGSIVNLSSIVGLRAGQFGGAIPYAVSKGGVIALSTAMAVDHGADGVRVNCIAPGHAYTPMVEARVDARGRDLRRRAAPLQTEGTAWDIAHAALFLASDDARWITGVTLPVDAGLLATTPLAMLEKLTS
jgi:NAD(P)-dependent dehydrogenase (short-subunit alcohol dehydrogenase family)